MEGGSNQNYIGLYPKNIIKDVRKIIKDIL